MPLRLPRAVVPCGVKNSVHDAVAEIAKAANLIVNQARQGFHLSALPLDVEEVLEVERGDKVGCLVLLLLRCGGIFDESPQPVAP